jgi:cellulose biosynthesis protein BcsQ
MKIIAVTNIKGGVGKTTTAVNLAYLCAAGGWPTLLWDLDPQGAASFSLRCETSEHVSAKRLDSGKQELPEPVLRSDYDNLDVLHAAALLLDGRPAQVVASRADGEHARATTNADRVRPGEPAPGLLEEVRAPRPASGAL